MSHSIAPRILVSVVSASLVTFLAVYCRQVRQQEITIGAIAARSADHSVRELRITNAGFSTTYGQYIVYPAGIPLRYPVVFRLAEPESVPADCTTFVGICRGVHVDTLAGCPMAPPFVLIDGVKPETFEQ